MSKHTYEIVTSGLGDTALVRSDGAVISQDSDNPDYREYLELLDEAEAK